MKITKNAKGEKFLTLSKAEHEALSKRYSFIRNAKIVKVAQPAPGPGQTPTPPATSTPSTPPTAATAPSTPQVPAQADPVTAVKEGATKAVGLLKQVQQSILSVKGEAGQLQKKGLWVLGAMQQAHMEAGKASENLNQVLKDLAKGKTMAAGKATRTVTAYGDVLDNTTPPPPGNDKNLSAFLQQVSDLYGQMFNMPGGLPDSLREQIATQVRSGLKNTQTQPGSAHAAPPAGGGLGADQSIDNGELDHEAPEDALNPNGVVDDLNYDNGALEDGSNGVLPPEGGLGNDVVDPAGHAGIEGVDNSDESLSEPTNRSSELDNFMGDKENGAASVVDTDYTDVHPQKARRPLPHGNSDADPTDTADDLSHMEAVHSEEYDEPDEEEYYASNKLDPSYSVYRSGAKFANGIDFSYLSEQLKGKK